MSVPHRRGVPNPPKPLGGRAERITGHACADADPELFFHPDGERGPAKRIREIKAKAVCARFFTRETCLREALTGSEIAGVWGGTTHEERIEILREAAS